MNALLAKHGRGAPASMRGAHAVCDEHGDVATES
jgi:hypothetical protein